MKAVKIILGIVAVLALVYVTLAFIGPDHVHVEREATINAPVEVVFAEVNSLQRWKEWDPWQAIDSNIVNTYSGPESGVGNRNEWKSDHPNVGNGSQEITESVQNERIGSHMTFDGQGEADGRFEFTDLGNTTQVKWSMDMDIPFGGRPFMLFMNMDEAIGTDFEKGLASLNTHCQGLGGAMEAARVTVEPFWVVSITDTITMEELDAIHEELYGELGAVAAANNLEMTGNPLAFWPMWGDTIVIEAAFPISAEAKLKNAGRAVCRQVPGGAAAKATHYGWYHSLEATHIALERWIEEEGLRENGLRWEEYEDPTAVLPDTSKVTTHIYVPVS